jgi:hypothetical protein
MDSFNYSVLESIKGTNNLITSSSSLNRTDILKGIDAIEKANLILDEIKEKLFENSLNKNPFTSGSLDLTEDICDAIVSTSNSPWGNNIHTLDM